jgi:hypothetical protein
MITCTISNILLTRSRNGNPVFSPSFSVTNYIACQCSCGYILVTSL